MRIYHETKNTSQVRPWQFFQIQYCDKSQILTKIQIKYSKTVAIINQFETLWKETLLFFIGTSQTEIEL